MTRFEHFEQKTRSLRIGLLLIFLILLLILSGCAGSKAFFLECEIDQSNLQDIDIPIRPALTTIIFDKKTGKKITVRTPVPNGILADDFHGLQLRVQGDNKMKSELRKQMAACKGK